MGGQMIFFDKYKVSQFSDFDCALQFLLKLRMCRIGSVGFDPVGKQIACHAARIPSIGSMLVIGESEPKATVAPIVVRMVVNRIGTSHPNKCGCIEAMMPSRAKRGMSTEAARQRVRCEIDGHVSRCCGLRFQKCPTQLIHRRADRGSRTCIPLCPLETSVATRSIFVIDTAVPFKQPFAPLRHRSRFSFRVGIFFSN